MSSLIDYIEQVVADLNEAGVRATMDTRSVNPPCVLLVPPEMRLDTGCGGTGDFKAYVLVPPPANADAWRAADRLAALAAEVISIETIRPSQYGVDETGAVPALELGWQRVISWP